MRELSYYHKKLVALIALVAGIIPGTKLFSQTFLDNIRIDHVLIAVDNLDSAKAEYEGYGFKVVYGGTAKNSLNALIFLMDGTLIELIGKDRMPNYFSFFHGIGIARLTGLMKDRITMFRKVPYGLFNYCLYTEHLDSTYNYLRSKSIRADKPKKFNRKRDDGRTIYWSLVGTKPYDLPFYINDYEPSRVSDSNYLNHKNGAIGIDSLEIETNKFDAYLDIYNRMYGQSPKITGNLSSRYARYWLKNQCVILRETTENRSTFGIKDFSKPTRVYLSLDKPQRAAKQLNDFIFLKGGTNKL